MSEKERVEEVRIFLGFNKTKFSEILGYSTPQSYTNYLSGGNNLSLKMIKALKTYDSRISIDWLLYGQGQMIISSIHNKNSQVVTSNKGIVSQVNDSHNKHHATTDNKTNLLQREVEYLKQMLEAKEEIIQLLKK